MRWRLVFSAPSRFALVRQMCRLFRGITVTDYGTIAMNDRTLPGLRVWERGNRWQLERREPS